MTAQKIIFLIATKTVRQLAVQSLGIILTAISLVACTQIPRQHSNSSVLGSDWYCNKGFEKSGDSCVSIFSNELPNKQSQASQIEGERLAAENDAGQQKQIELEKQLAQQKKNLEEGPKHREELQQKPAAKQKNSGPVSANSANRKATAQKENRVVSKQQAIPQPDSPISGGLPPLKKNN